MPRRTIPSIKLDRQPSLSPEQTHEIGARDYGLAWLTANQAMASNAGMYTDISTPECKRLLPYLTLHIMHSLCGAGMLRPDVEKAAIAARAANSNKRRLDA